MTTYLQDVLNTPTPQTQPLDNRQVLNEAGGYVYPVDDAARMHRFLIMGSENGSYYRDQRTLTLENAAAAKRYIDQDGLAAVEHIVNISRQRRAPRVSPALFCLAIAASCENPDTVQAALKAMPEVARTASMLAEFAGYADSMRGWGPSLRKAVARWYTSREPADLALQVIKFRKRSGWTHLDLLRKAHPVVTDDEPDLRHIIRWVTRGETPPKGQPFDFIHAFEAAQEITDADELAKLITDTRLPWEAIPPIMRQHDQIWQALGPIMPPLAFVRNLPALTAHNAIQPMDCQWAVEKLGRMRSRTRADGSVIPAPVHPVNLLIAMLVYRMGHSIDGENTWKPVQPIVAALDEAFHNSFTASVQTNERIFLAIDTSGSMNSPNIDRISGLTPRMAAAAVALSIARREPNHMITACSHKMEDFDITARDSIKDVMGRADALEYGCTDMALPILHALENKIPVDCFIIATDGQTFAGSVHPKEALRRYRQKMGIPAKAVQLAFISNRFSIMDPTDAGTLDIPGFDAAVPAILADFILGSKNAPPTQRLDEDE